MNELTQRQREVYDFLKESIATEGYPPSVREIMAHFGFRAPNGVMCHLIALEKKGWISRVPHKSRAIRLLVD